MEPDMETPALLKALDPDMLVGKPVDEATSVVEAAGGQVQVIAPGQPVTADYRPHRVRLTAEDGTVSSVAFG